MSEALRDVCQRVLRSLVVVEVLSDDDTEALRNIDRLETFAKQQRAEVWREAAKDALKVAGLCEDIMRKTAYQGMAGWCESKARELDA